MNSKQILYLLTIALLLTSCSSMYIPAVRSIPLLEKKGEFQAEGGISTNSVYANVSAAITNDIAVSANGNLSYRNFSDRYDLFTHKDAEEPTGLLEPDLRGKFSHRYIEAGIGKINIHPSFPMKLELFGGAGMGIATDVVSNSRYDHDGNYKTNYYSIFAQGNLGLKKRIVEAGASVRLTYSIFNYTANLYNNDEDDDFFKKRLSNVGIEPMLFGRVGGNNLKAVLRIGINLMPPISYGDEKISRYHGLSGLGYTMFHYSLGVSYRIGGNKSHKFH